jgi:hypothetical protein
MKTAMQELFSQLEIEHPNLFNTNTLEGRKFINDYYKFFELEKKQIIFAHGNKTKNIKIITSDDSYILTGEDYYKETFKIETK